MILNDNSTQQINTLVIQLQNKITNLANEFRKLNNNINDLDSEISDLEKRISSNENDADNNISDLNSEISDLEKRISSNENAAAAMNTEISANTEAISGKADKIHTHTKSQITDFPTSLPANGGTATKATQDGNGNVITSTYVKKSGDTLTGPIIMKANQCTLDTAQLDMKNSDIKGANAIWFDDHTEVGEGLKFPRSSGSNYDFMRLDDGKIKVAPNVTGNANTATESIVAYTSDIPTSLPANGGTADSANKIEPNYTNVELTEVTSYTDKYIKLAYCHWYDAGTLQVYLSGNNFADTLVINFGGGNGVDPMLCGHYNGNSHRVYSVIAQKGSAWNSGYSIYVKVGQETNLIVDVALLRGNCTFDISESTTAPTNISEWSVNYGLFGNIVSPEITSLEQRVAALESKI